jgi:hypothetical protein
MLSQGIAFGPAPGLSNAVCIAFIASGISGERRRMWRSLPSVEFSTKLPILVLNSLMFAVHGRALDVVQARAATNFRFPATPSEALPD